MHRYARIGWLVTAFATLALGAQPASCSANAKFKVKPGKHRIEFRAIDTAGNVDPTPATAKWKVKPKGG